MHAHAPVDDKAPGGRTGCSGACHSCGIATESGASGSSIRGARMVVAALLVFVLPLLTAVAGARLGGGAQVGGAAIGLLAGVLAARLCVACSCALREDAP